VEVYFGQLNRSSFRPHMSLRRVKGGKLGGSSFRVGLQLTLRKGTGLWPLQDYTLLSVFLKEGSQDKKNRGYPEGTSCPRNRLSLSTCPPSSFHSSSTNWIPGEIAL